MSHTELVLIAQRLATASTPEAVFGPLAGTAAERQRQLHTSYRQLSKAVHPDCFTDAADQAMATAAFTRLTAWLERAEARIAYGCYGTTVKSTAAHAAVRVQVGKRAYLVGDLLTTGDLCNLYHCTDEAGTPAIFKVARHPDDNDLVANEAAVLGALARHPEAAKYRPYFPTLLHAFDYTDGSSTLARRTHVLTRLNGFLSLRQVRERVPEGLPTGHMGWIWRRLLTALAVTHRAGFIHGAVLPDHVLIHPLERGLVLIDWAYAVPRDNGQSIRAISTAYEPWYPSEVWERQPPTPATDITLSARCMVELLGGDPLTVAVPSSVPERLRLFLKGTQRPRPGQRPQDAAVLLEEFDALLYSLFGPRRYTPLHLPPPPEGA